MATFSSEFLSCKTEKNGTNFSNGNLQDVKYELKKIQPAN